jgi:nucleoside-diphosphate-sugar epimerase/3-hydroxymyristoyl/3-hydroxydecanoyl-(acyl carrier protein) dehydratase
MLVVDRVTGIEALPGTPGTGVIQAETDVRPDSWFLDPGGRIPACLVAEAAQIALPLIAYLGLGSGGGGARTVRVLETEAIYHGRHARVGQTLRHEFRVTGHAEHRDMTLVACAGESRAAGEPSVTFGRFQVGVFGPDAVGAAGRLAWDPAAARLDQRLPFDPPAGISALRRFGPDQVQAFFAGSAGECFGPRWGSMPALQDGPLRMLREVSCFDAAGGPWRRGYLRAEYPVSPSDWYFGDHFAADPCMPASLMWQCGAQAMSFYLAALGYPVSRPGWQFDMVPGHCYRSRFRGEATPGTRQMTCELFVSSVTDAPHPTVQADILISFDGVKATHFPAAAMRLVPAAAPVTAGVSPARPEHHVLTGATGFVASALALELLDRTGATITCVARRRPGLSADERVKAALHKTAVLFGRDDLAGQIEARCRGVDGDVTKPGCGADLTSIGPADQVWHSAALLSFEDSRKDDVLGQNVEGTRHVLDLARRLSAHCFNYISTAYVAGRRTGPIAEEPPDENTECNNWYERSKIAAEAVVRASGLPLIRIMRPSIVIGHSRTLATTSESAMYNLARSLTMARRQLAVTAGDVLATHDWLANADPDAEFNFIPVDRLAAAAACLARAGAPAGVYHLTNTRNTTVREFTAALCGVLGVKEPVYVDDEAGFSSVDRLVSEHVGVYRPYFRGGVKEFGTDNARSYLDGPVLDFPLPRELLADFLRWYAERNLPAVPVR